MLSKPAITGVPIAPVIAKRPSMRSTTTIDVIGENPREINNKGTIAPGVPKPDTLSKKAVKKNAKK
ncbi:hypothetical protein GCM10023315_22100 [Algibacter aquimarinus]|uniref:Uncharacterized protein n=1 Tax=Algibacter aquimarinus TaxID=1136748 RepID=A0ABP9HIM9_9FLAO